MTIDGATVPMTRRLGKTGQGGKSRSVVIPSHIIDAWENKYGNVEEVDIYFEGKSVVVCPRGSRD